MRKTALTWSPTVLLAVALTAGCYDRVTKHDLSPDEHRIPLRVRILDISSSHLSGHGDITRDIDEFIFAEEAQELLQNIFAEVSADPTCPHADIDIDIHLRTKREDAVGKTVAEMVVRKGYAKQVLVKDSFRGRYDGLSHDTNDTIRNRASFRALKAAIQSLRDNQTIEAYAQELAQGKQ